MKGQSWSCHKSPYLFFFFYTISPSQHRSRYHFMLQKLQSCNISWDIWMPTVSEVLLSFQVFESTFSVLSKVSPQRSVSWMFYFSIWFNTAESNDGSLAGLWRTLHAEEVVTVRLLKHRENNNKKDICPWGLTFKTPGPFQVPPRWRSSSPPHVWAVLWKKLNHKWDLILLIMIVEKSILGNRHPICKAKKCTTFINPWILIKKYTIKVFVPTTLKSFFMSFLF